MDNMKGFRGYRIEFHNAEDENAQLEFEDRGCHKIAELKYKKAKCGQKLRWPHNRDEQEGNSVSPAHVLYLLLPARDGTS